MFAKASRAGSQLEAQRLEDRRQEAGEECRSVAARCGAQAHDVRWHWIKGHAGHAENERADQLARDGWRRTGNVICSASSRFAGTGAISYVSPRR
jgi:ribonuclease HI